jgi:DNA-binding CsgD family transcriptional regulator
MTSVSPLSPRQAECLKLAASGMTSSQIGGVLNISARTVDDYISDACHRLGVRSRTQAVALAATQGWLGA